ncbi:MAG: transferase, partial [Deltaproteobacteria bacterium]|nr:transferase [Deltaproteobacteria bacterium]
YANIHGSTLEGCFLGPFATVDLMNLHSCIIGEFSYVQVGELFQTIVDPGTILIKNPSFSFKYKFEKKILEQYIGVNESYQPRGIIYDFVKEKESDYESLFDVVNIIPVEAPSSSAVSRYAVVKGKTSIGENVLVSQHAFLENADMGKGSNAQENTYIINSRLAGFNITAHGGKIINAEIGLETFVGFNCFLNGKTTARLIIGDNCIVMPHTIIDSTEPVEIPDDHLIWGYIGSQNDLDSHSISLDDLSDSRDTITIGKMTFIGKGSVFIGTFKKRINHILHANGAFFKDDKNRGHAQDDQVISFNTIQPYRTGANKGIYPSIRIEP